MTVWPIQRQWSCSLSDSPNEETALRTNDLADQLVLVLLGAAGTGKSFEMERMIERDRARGKDVRVGRLASLACDAQGLASALARLSDGARQNTVIFLDSLDESMIPDRFAALKLAEWIRNALSPAKAPLRIACRSAVWPQEVVFALRHTYGASNTMTAILQPLDEHDIRRAAEAEGGDAEKFIAEIARIGSHSLSQHPLTLRMLLRVFRASGTLPSSRSDLFAEGVRRLAEEREERRSVRTDGDVPVEETLEVANWVASITLLSGRDTVDLKDEPEPGTVGLAELTTLSSFNSLLTAHRIEALAASGLCEGRGNRQFRFGHRQFAEFLAGRTIATLLPHQARSLLESGLGWTHGVASPLRETAAFAAHENPGIAEWIAESDPLVIGQSGVVDDKLRRRATLALIRKFRSHQLTDAQIRANSTEFVGLRYRDAVADLEPVLRERGPESEDVLEFAINLVEVWELPELSESLADLMLDPGAPEHPRVAAGYALAKIGTPAAKLRLKPLIGGGGPDPDLQLHGLALRCNWPDNLTVGELLAALPPRTRHSFTGAYEGFLFELDSQGFQADGDRAAGLQWASSHLRRGRDYDPAVRTAKRIARAALNDLADPIIRELLATLMLEASRAHLDSPLGVVRRTKLKSDAVDEPPDEPPLKGRREERRILLDEMARLAKPDDHWWWAARETPHLLAAEDFRWLLGRAIDASFPDPARTHYAELARVLFRIDEPTFVEAWFNVHDLEPIRSVFNIPTVMELDSKAAQDAKRNWREQQEYSRPEKPEPLTPSPKERIASLLDRCETKDFRFFHHLCMEMTLQDDSTHYGVERVLFETPGWNHADSRTRTRIVAAAKQFLERDHESIEWAKTAEFNSIHRGGMAAYWLIDHVDRQPVAPSIWNRVGYSVAGAAIATLPSAVLVILFSGDDLGSGWLVAMVLVAAGAFAALYRFLNHTARGKSWLAARIARSFPTWIASRSKEWWNRWAWYIMRELHPNLMGEAEEPKLLAMRTLMAQAPEKVRNQMLRLAGDADPKSKSLFQSLLPLIQEVGDSGLDEQMIRMLEQGTVARDRFGDTADHVLRNGGKKASDACVARLRILADEAPMTAEHPAVAMSVALLTNADSPYWDQVLALFETRPDLRQFALGAYAHSERWRRRSKSGEQVAQEPAPAQLGVLVRQLFLAFPPETDPVREGAYAVGPDDSGRDLRNQVLSALGDKGTIDAVSALRGLERELGSKYPWLRRPRARAEREYRHTRWNAVPPESVARILSSSKSRLVRTPQDVLDGIGEAIEQYSASLRNVSPSPLEDLWNTPSDAKPSPKLEERASDKLCEAIREYFKARAVTAGRELQIRRRLVEKDAGGEAGSRVDVFVTVPAIGTVTGEPIEVPVEVKRSSNKDVKTSLKSQLVDRYMSEVNADVGVYAVMWFDAPNMADGFAPKWPDIETARQELMAQAEAERRAELTVRAIVVDCSLA